MSVKGYDFFSQLGYIDGITIIDTSGTILFTVKFNPRFNPEINDMDEIIGKKLFEIFPNINKTNSTLVKAMEHGMPVYKKCQRIIDIKGNKIDTMNVSLPIKSNGKIIGAIEISRDITRQKGVDNSTIELNPKMFNGKVLKKHIKPDRAKYTLEDIVSDNNKIKELKHFVKKIADSTAPVFIYGVTGTGKELFAHAIHNCSDRANFPFIAQNCAAIPENLLESILFGTTKGSFTGAYDNPGLFELAEGGTIFLDEINCMPLHLNPNY